MSYLVPTLIGQYGSFYYQYVMEEGGEREEFNFCMVRRPYSSYHRHTRQMHHSKLGPEIVLPRYLNGTGGEIKIQKTQLRRHACLSSVRY
jgi:hypothetical protein